MSFVQIFHPLCLVAIGLNSFLILRAAISMAAILLIGKNHIRGEQIFSDKDLATFGLHFGQLMTAIASCALTWSAFRYGLESFDVAFANPLPTIGLLALYLAGYVVQNLHLFPQLFIWRTEWIAD